MKISKLLYSESHLKVLLHHNLKTLKKSKQTSLLAYLAFFGLISLILIFDKNISVAYYTICIIVSICVLYFAKFLVDYQADLSTVKTNHHFLLKKLLSSKYSIYYDDTGFELLSDKNDEVLLEEFIKWFEIKYVVLINNELLIITPGKRSKDDYYISQLAFDNPNNFTNILDILKNNNVPINVFNYKI